MQEGDEGDIGAKICSLGAFVPSSQPPNLSEVKTGPEWAGPALGMASMVHTEGKGTSSVLDCWVPTPPPPLETPGPGEFISPLCASISSSVKWERWQCFCVGVSRGSGVSQWNGLRELPGPGKHPTHVSRWCKGRKQAQSILWAGQTHVAQRWCGSHPWTWSYCHLSSVRKDAVWNVLGQKVSGGSTATGRPAGPWDSGHGRHSPGPQNLKGPQGWFPELMRRISWALS